MGLDSLFGDYFIAAQALYDRDDDQTESDVDASDEGGTSRPFKHSSRFRLRNIVRKILHVIKWELRTEEYNYKHNYRQMRGSARGTGRANIIERGLSDRRGTRMLRVALTVEPAKRTPQMLELIGPYIARLKCCESMNVKVRSQLPTVVEYECLDKGQLIVKQGDEGESYYLIVSGTVDVMIEEGGSRKYLNILERGQGFGEVALVNKGPRTASIVTREPTELLRIDRNQFHEVLRASKLQEITKKHSFLSTHSSFHDLPEDILKKFVDNAVIKAYKPAEMIIKVGEETVDHLVIVISGECFVETKVSLDYYKLQDGRFLLDLPSSTRPDIQRYKSHLSSHSDGDSTTCSTSTKISTPSPNLSTSTLSYTNYIDTSTRSYSRAHLSELEAVSRYRAYFSNDVKSISTKQYHLCLRRIGPKEYFSVSNFIAKNKCNVGSVKKCECLLLPKLLFQKFNMSSVLEEMSNTELRCTLSVEEAFEGFLRRRHWELYKKRLVSDVLKNKSDSR